MRNEILIKRGVALSHYGQFRGQARVVISCDSSVLHWKYETTVVHYDEDYAKTHEKVDLYSTVEACPVQAISALMRQWSFYVKLQLPRQYGMLVVAFRMR